MSYWQIIHSEDTLWDGTLRHCESEHHRDPLSLTFSLSALVAAYFYKQSGTEIDFWFNSPSVSSAALRQTLVSGPTQLSHGRMEADTVYTWRKVQMIYNTWGVLLWSVGSPPEICFCFISLNVWYLCCKERAQILICKECPRDRPWC